MGEFNHNLNLIQNKYLTYMKRTNTLRIVVAKKLKTANEKLQKHKHPNCFSVDYRYK